MATEKEEVILEFQIDQDSALQQLERTKKSILQIKEEQKELNKAYKEGNVTLDEYVAESVRLEGILKKQQSTYNTVQKSVTGVKTQLDKLIDSNKKISKDMEKTSQAFKEAAGNINVAGVNVGSLTTKIASFANPATAAVSIVGALGAAYARSTLGAKDLEFAQNQLNTAVTIATNSFAGFVSSAEEGEGIVASFTNEIIRRFNPALAVLSKIAANNIEALEDLGRDEIEIRDKVNQRLEENQELLTDIQSDQTQYNDKLSKADLIITNIRRNEEELVDILEEQRKLLEFQLSLDKENDALKTAVLLKTKQIGAAERDAEKRVQAIVRLQNNLNEAEKKRLDNLEKTRFGTLKIVPEFQQDDALQKQKEATDFINSYEINSNGVKLSTIRNAEEVTEEEITEFKRREAKKRQQITRAQTQAELQFYADAANAIAGIFEQGSDLQKAFALISIGIDTAEAISGLVNASENNPGNAYTFGAAGGAQFATGIIRILTNIATATSYISQAAGGGDFITKGPTMLMVGDNPGGVERVTVEPISGKGQTKIYGPNLMAMAGGGSITTTGNPGGLLSNTMTAETNQTLLMVNAMKRMPKPQVAVRDIRRELRSVEVKDRASRAR